MVRTMAVSTVTPLPKSQPDISKLNTFTGYIVTVTKHLGPRGTVGTGIISSKVMSKDALLALPEQLPSLPGAGPGYYSFTVTDAGGTGDDTWLVKLGPDIPAAQQQEVFSMAGPNGVSPGGFSGASPPIGEGVIHLGHNFFYNEAMGTLTTPWRTIVSWKQGDPMPQPPTSAAASSLTMPNPSQWGASPWPPSTGWGGYPVNDGVEAKLKAVEAQLAEERQRRREDDMRAEQARRDTEVRQMIADSNARFEKLIEKLATKPVGESPEMLAIRAQNETMQRRLDEEKREREVERREASMREEIRRNREDFERVIRDLNANKSDPMLPMLMQMMQQMNAGAMESIKAIQTATATANTSAERQTQSLVEQLRSTIMSPMQMIQLMQTSEGKGADMAKMMIESMKETSKMQHEVYGQLLDVASQGGNPPWVTAIEAIASKVGPIGEALANRAAQPKVVERVVRVAVPVDPATGQPIRVTPPPAAAPPAIAGAPGAAPAPGSTAPTEIRNTEVEAAPAGKGKKGRKAKGKKKTAVPTAAEAAKIPAGKGPGGALTIAQIRDLDPDVLADAMSKFSDNVFFGDQLGTYVAQIRQRVAAGAATPEELAKFLLDQRNFLATIDPMPPAVELFQAEQIEVLIERMIPEAEDEYREKVVTIIEDAIEAEDEGDAEDEA